MSPPPQGLLSNAQLETIVYACMRFKQDLPNGGFGDAADATAMLLPCTLLLLLPPLLDVDLGLTCDSWQSDVLRALRAILLSICCC